MIIKQSFLELLSEKPINHVTVKAVCEKAEVNRATFYNHYDDCFDLLGKIEVDLINEMQQFVRKSRHESVSEIFRQIILKIRENSSFYFSVISRNGDISFAERIFSSFHEEVYPVFMNQVNIADEEKSKWQYFFVVSGCGGILVNWINDGMEEEVDEIVSYMNEFVRKVYS